MNITGSCHCENIKYRLKTATPIADLIVRQCGVMPYASMVNNNASFAVINLNASDIKFDRKNIRQLSIKDDSIQSRIERRLKTWSKLFISN